jgi:hypothetical protein
MLLYDQKAYKLVWCFGFWCFGMTPEIKGLSENGGATNSMPQNMPYKKDTQEILVYRKTTWGSYGQHSNIYTFVITPDFQTKPIWDVIKQLRYENNDSRKNFHRLTYAQLSDVLKLENYILKIVYDDASSSKREVSVNYYLVSNSRIIQLESKSGFRDSIGFFDLVELPDGRKLKVRKDKVEVLEKGE